jgi:tripartite ATP-independent transporter DctP family solute receptor
MKKFTVCLSLLLILSVSMLFAAGTTETTVKKEIVLTVAHVAIEGQYHPYNTGLAKMQEVLDQKTGGQIKLKIYAGGTLSNDEKEMLTMIQNDSLDMAIVAPSPLATFSPMISILGLPYIFKSLDHAETIMSGEVGKVMRDELVKKDFYPLSWWIGKGFRSVNSATKPVKTPADMKGMKIRVMQDPAYIDAFNAFGANPVPIAWGELHTSLQTKTVDAHENDPPVIDEYGFIEFAKYFSLTEHSLMPIVVVMKASKLEALGPELKAALLEAADAARTVSRKTADELLQKAYKGIESQGGVVNEVDKAAFLQLAKPVIESYKTKFGAEGARLIDIMLK